MAVFYEGRRGSGKSKFAIEQMQKRLLAGRSVATNLDLFLDKLCPDNPKAHYVRLPDFPRSCDLRLLGKAYDSLDHDNPESYDEQKNGLVVLDELLTSFNSRNWNDPDRIQVVNWIVQSRKDGWDLALIGQSIDAIDKQIKETVIDELYSFRSSANLFPGFFWKVCIKPWFDKLVPKFHICNQYDGRKIDKKNKNATVHFRRNDLHDCYKTSQQFKKDVKIVFDETKKKPIEIDMRASYSVLHPDYFKISSKEENKQDLTTKSNNSVKKPTERKSIYPLLVIFLSALCLFLFLKPIQASSNSTHKNNTSSQFISKSKDQLAESDLGLIFINCSNISTTGEFDYCFNDASLNIIEPSRVGYQVIWVNECHAKLKRDSIIYDVYCNPVKIASEKPNFQDESI